MLLLDRHRVWLLGRTALFGGKHSRARRPIQLTPDAQGCILVARPGEPGDEHFRAVPGRPRSRPRVLYRRAADRDAAHQAGDPDEGRPEGEGPPQEGGERPLGLRPPRPGQGEEGVHGGGRHPRSCPARAPGPAPGKDLRRPAPSRVERREPALGLRGGADRRVPAGDPARRGREVAVALPRGRAPPRGGADLLLDGAGLVGPVRHAIRPRGPARHGGRPARGDRPRAGRRSRPTTPTKRHARARRSSPTTACGTTPSPPTPT